MPINSSPAFPHAEHSAFAQFAICIPLVALRLMCRVVVKDAGDTVLVSGFARICFGSFRCGGRGGMCVRFFLGAKLLFMPLLVPDRPTLVPCLGNGKAFGVPCFPGWFGSRFRSLIRLEERSLCPRGCRAAIGKASGVFVFQVLFLKEDPVCKSDRMSRGDFRPRMQALQKDPCVLPIAAMVASRPRPTYPLSAASATRQVAVGCSYPMSCSFVPPNELCQVGHSPSSHVRRYFRPSSSAALVVRPLVRPDMAWERKGPLSLHVRTNGFGRP